MQPTSTPEQEASFRLWCGWLFSFGLFAAVMFFLGYPEKPYILRVAVVCGAVAYIIRFCLPSRMNKVAGLIFPGAAVMSARRLWGDDITWGHVLMFGAAFLFVFGGLAWIHLTSRKAHQSKQASA